MTLDPSSPRGDKTCPNCGAPLPEHTPQGLCPKCLFAGFAGQTEDGTGTGVAATPAPSLTIEELAPHFPQFEILECLGRGGMGIVYKARQKSLNRFVALKLLTPERVTDPRFAERFSYEAQALAALNHPNIVTIYDFGQAGGFYFLLMEFIDGVNLRQAMRAGRFTPEQALAVVPPVCEALQYAHEHGIVHRDIKPENLLLDKDGRVKIADFGIAKMLGEDALAATASSSAEAAAATAEGTLASAAGTPQYMAPEQKARRRADHRADIYSLGVVLYELLTGELPADKLQPPSTRSRGVQIDVRLDEIVLRALEQTPELRYQTAGEFRTQVETIAAGTQTGSAAAMNPSAHAAPAPEPRYARSAIWAAVWITLSMVVIPPFLWHESETHEFMGHGPFASVLGCFIWFVFLMPSFMAPLGATLLGWFAVSKIRSSHGSLHGLWLAVFDGLFYPLLALDALVIFVARLTVLMVETHLAHGGFGNFTPAIRMLQTDWPYLPQLLAWLVVIILDWAIIRVVWRAANRSASTSGPANPAPPRKAGPLLLTGIATLVACLSGVLLLAAIRFPSRAALLLLCACLAPLAGAFLLARARWRLFGFVAIVIFALQPLAWLALRVIRQRAITPSFNLTVKPLSAASPSAGVGATLPDGATIQLVALSASPRGSGSWWTPEGRPIPSPAWGELNASPANIPSADSPFRQIVVSAEGAYSPSVLGLDTDENPGMSGTFAVGEGGRSLIGWRGFMKGFRRGATTANLNAYVASEQFHDDNAGKVVRWSEQSLTGEMQGEKFTLGHLTSRHRHAAASLSLVFQWAGHYPKYEHRLRAVAADGRSQVGQVVEGKSHDNLLAEVYEFDDLQPADILEIHLELRPIHVVQFQNVALLANQQTTVEIVGAKKIETQENPSRKLEFGPVTEQVIALGNSPNSFYSLDKKGYVAGPQNFQPLADHSDLTENAQIARQRAWTWLTENDVDFLAQRDHGHPVLTLSDMLAFPCDNESDFDRWTPQDLLSQPAFPELMAKAVRPNFHTPLTGNRGGKITVAFQTRYERYGLVQVMGVTNNPPGVKIRYKLLQTPEKSWVETTPEDPHFTFGSKAERIFTSADANGDGVLGFRFAGGELIKPPEAITGHFRSHETSGFTPELKQWMLEEKVDLLLHLGQKGYDVLSVDMRNGFAGQPMEWDAIPAGRAAPLLARMEAENTKPGPRVGGGFGYRDGLSSVDVFRTRGGLIGYYQLRGLADLDGLGVALRYKLILPAESKAAESKAAESSSAGESSRQN